MEEVLKKEEVTWLSHADKHILLLLKGKILHAMCQDRFVSPVPFFSDHCVIIASLHNLMPK